MSAAWNFTGKTALITGASGGIGRAVAKLFGIAGANLVLLDLDASALSSAANEIACPCERVLLEPLDVTDFNACEAAIARVVERFSSLDIIIPSAGIYRDETFANMTPEQWRMTMAVNLDGVFNILRAALPALNKNSAVVNVASRAGHSGGSLGHAHYGATKGGILALSRGLARELAPDIRVNCVSPGVIETTMTAPALAKEGAEILKQTPMARFGAPDEIAEAIAFLASQNARFITGETIHVNGGIYMD